MEYRPLEEKTVTGIQAYLEREVRRLTQMINNAKENPRATAIDRAMIGIWLGEKFGYQHVLGQIRKAKG